MSNFEWINWLYATWSILSIGVVSYSIRGAIRHWMVNKNFEPPFSFYIAIGITSLGGGIMLRWWWLVWRAKQLRDLEHVWMTTHYFVIIAACLVITGLILHLLNMTKEMNRYRTTLLWLIIAILGGYIVQDLIINAPTIVIPTPTTHPVELFGS